MRTPTRRSPSQRPSTTSVPVRSSPPASRSAAARARASARGSTEASPRRQDAADEGRASGPARARGSGAGSATRPRARAPLQVVAPAQLAPPRRGRARRAGRPVALYPVDSPLAASSSATNSGHSARRRRASSPAARGSPKVSSPTGASIPAATLVAPAGGSARSSTHTRAPRLGRAPGAGEADHATADEHRIETALLGQAIASAGITRIRFRRSVTSMPPSQPSCGLPFGLRCYPSRESAAGQVIIERMSLAPPEGNGPLRRERLRTARLYFVCDARPRGDDPEPLLRAALGGGVDIVQLREKELGRAEIERAAVDLPPHRRHLFGALFIVNDDPDLARACDADGVHVGQDDASVEEARAAARARRDHRPVDPLRGADRRRRRARHRLLRGRAGLGDADETGAAGGRARAGHATPPRTRPTRSSRSAGSSPLNAEQVVAGRGAAALRGAGDPRRRRPRSRRRSAAPRLRRRRGLRPEQPGRAARPSPRRGGAWRPVAEARQKRKQRARRPDGRAATPSAEVRNQAAREALVPLAEGERPPVVTVGAIVAGLVALSILVAYAGRGEGQRRGAEARPGPRPRR